MDMFVWVFLYLLQEIFAQNSTNYNRSETGSVRVMSYNLYGWNALILNPWKAENIYKAIRNIKPDILGAQECEGQEDIIAAAIGSDYAVAGHSSDSLSGTHAILYNTSVLVFEGHGEVILPDQDLLGYRTVEYSLFTHITTGSNVSVFNTHLCICNGEELLRSAKIITETIQQYRTPGSRVILTGDFNCYDGFEDSKPVRYLKGELESTPVPLDDTFRVVNDESVDGTTLTNEAGKMDYVMVDKEAEVLSAWIDRNWDDVGKASDHWPIAAVVGL